MMPKTSKHAVSVLIDGDSGKNIVRIIFKTDWIDKVKSPEIHRILKIHNSPKILTRFEDYRKLVKAKAVRNGAVERRDRDERCIADGNELLRFNCSTFMCDLGLNGNSSICNQQYCLIWVSLRNGNLDLDTIGISNGNLGSWFSCFGFVDFECLFLSYTDLHKRIWFLENIVNKRNLGSCLFLLKNLLNMYYKAGEMDVAHRMLDKMSKPNLVSYNSLIFGYNQMGAFDKAMRVFVEARTTCSKLDKFTYAGALYVCTQTGDIKLGKLIHGLIVVNGMIEKAFLTNSLIDMYCKCGCVDQARFLFENSEELDEIS